MVDSKFRLRFFLQGILIVVTFCSWTQVGSAAEVHVTAIGKAPYSQDVTLSRSVAIADAKRSAAEKAKGTLIKYYTQPNLREIGSYVSSHLKFKILSEGRKGQFYEVTIEATVTVPEGVEGRGREEYLADDSLQSYQTKFKKGYVDWKSGIVLVDGIANIKGDFEDPLLIVGARRAALLDAQGNALKVLELLNVTSDSNGADYLKDKNIFARIEGILRGAVVMDEAQTRNIYRVKLKIPLWGVKGLSSVFCDDLKGSEVAEPKIHPEIEQAIRSARLPEKQLLKTGAASKRDVIKRREKGHVDDTESKITGVIIDARGASAEPAVLPRVLTEDNLELYSVRVADRDSLIEQGLAAYAVERGEKKSGMLPHLRLREVSISSATDLAGIRSRVGGSPLVIKALSSAGDNRADLVIGKSDSRRLIDSELKYGVLSRCKVIILLDSPVAVPRT